jgi:alpha-beta hydrolase superfamily lysophospholipase
MGPGVYEQHQSVFSPVSSSIFSVLSRRLAEEGLAVCHFAWRSPSHGSSMRTPRRVRECADDVVAAVNSLRVAHDDSTAGTAPLPVVLVAHSSEACAAVMAAGALSLSGAEKRALGPLAGVVALASGMRVNDSRYNYGVCDTTGCLETFAKHGTPLMLMHGLADTIVEAQASRLIFESARGPRAAVLLRDCDHQMDARADEVTARLLEWVPALQRRYLVLGDSCGQLACREADAALGIGRLETL